MNIKPDDHLSISMDFGLGPDSPAYAICQRVGDRICIVDSGVHLTKKGRRILARLAGRANHKRNRRARRARINRRGW